MGWEYRIIAPSEATNLAADPSFYIPRTTLGPYRAIRHWLTSRAGEWHQRDIDSFTITIGKEGYVLVNLVTSRQRFMHAEAFRQRELNGDPSYDFISRFMASYVPAENEGVVEVSIQGWGSGDVTLIAQCAVWLNATVFDCQTSEMLSAEQWMRRVESWRVSCDGV